MSGIFALGVLALPIVVLVALLLWAARRSKPGSPSTTLTVTRFIAIGYAALTLVFTVVGVISTLVSDAVPVSIPVRQFWPEAYPWVTIQDGPPATVVEGGFSLAEVTAAGLGTDARLLLAAGHALQGLTFTVIAITVALLCHRLLNGTAFKPAISRAINISAIAIAAGGVLWQACFWIGGTIASEQVLQVRGWTSEEPAAGDPRAALDPLATGLPEPTFALTIDFWPLMLGLALAAVAAAFRYGERLQRDTEGLV